MNSELVFRKPAFYGTAGAAALVVFVIFVVEVLSAPSGSTFFGAFIVAVFIYVFWVLGWQSAVRVGSAGVIVDNLFFRHSIPWRDIAEIRTGNGLLIVTRGGERVGSLMYGGSLIGMFSGDKRSRAVAHQIRGAQDRAATGTPNDDDGNKSYHSSVNFQVLPIVAVLIATELVAGLSLAFH